MQGGLGGDLRSAGLRSRRGESMSITTACIHASRRRQVRGRVVIR